MKKILGYNGKTLEELKVIFHCDKCGCDFEADYGDYYDYVSNWGSYCPKCDKQVFVKKEG